jgi:hypothetical protein
MLTMSGRPALVMIDNLVALGLNIGLNIWLIPQYGILGCAAAWAVSLGLVNLARVTQVWLTMRMLPFGAEIAKGLAAGGAAFTIALAVQRTLTGPPALLAGAVTVAVVYLSVLVILGITSEDRVLLRTLALRVLPGRFARRHAAPPGVLYRGLRPQTSEPPAPGPETPRRPDLKPLSGLGTTVPRDGRHL